MGIQRTVAEKQVERCDLCGTPLFLSSGAPGCLNCLLAGGRDGAEERRYQHYEVTMREDGMTPSELGRGAMGITYRALDLNLGAPVALKVISARYSNEDEARDRFRREAQTAAQLRHPNVASVYHFGETAAGQCFYAMELVEGETLESRVRREGPLGAEVVLEIATQVARALLAAEKHGLVHRDLKPSNLMLVPNESGNEHAPGVKVIDFGLAKAVTGEGEVQSLTQTRFAGTPGFASPEQHQSGEQKLDTRSDIYSLGATLWYALTEEITPPGSSLPVERLVARKVPALLIRLLCRTLATAPAERPQSARALLAELELCRAAVEAAPRRRQRLRRAAVGLGLFAICGAGLTSYLLQRERAATRLPRDKSIAVLPLENLSDDKSNAFFADGIHDDVLTSLAKISDLKVISRTSVMQYRGAGAAPGNLREIARALDVANVLEGSVRRVDDRVVVNVQLIDARTDRPIWAERYDRTIADSLGLQGELATEIAKALKAKLAPEEKASLGTKPTNNPEAYVAYLRALDFEENADVPLSEYYATLDRLYAQAIALDPTFALAQARASMSYSQQFFQTHDPALKVKARALAEEALRLSPALGEVHLALGIYFDLTELDYSAALEQFTIALTALPNNVEALISTARIYRRQGRWREAIAGFVHARSLDPHPNPFDMVQTYWMVRDWRNAAAEMKRNLAKGTGSPFPTIGLAQTEIVANFDLAAARVMLQEIPAGVDPDGVVTLASWNLSMLERDWARAEKRLADFPADEFPDAAPKSFYQAQTALARGDMALSHTLLEKVRPAFERKVRDHPDASGDHAALGILYAYMGRKEEAIRESRRAVELCPESTDALNGVQRACNLALVYALTGEVDQAVALIERLLRTPGATTRQDFYDGGITQAELRLRWQWDKLRGDPGFQKLLDGPEPKTIY
jgi:serine/threonine protein kinase/Flp pilus assembly protein TadD